MKAIEAQTVIDRTTNNRYDGWHTEYTYHDCLVPAKWLKAHHNALDGFEPTIDITYQGKALHLNGNYKQGLIKEFMVKARNK